MKNPIRTALGAFAVLGLWACGGGGGGGSTGHLSVTATDAPFPATEGCLSAALIEVDGVEVQKVDGSGGWFQIPLDESATGGVVTFDLLDLRAGVEENLAFGELPTGTYHQIRLHIVSAVLQFEDGSPDQPFTVPSGMQSGLKINVQPHFVIAAGQTTPLVLDIDISKSFHVAGTGGTPTCDDLKSGEEKVIFNPVVRALDMNENGVVSGLVTDASAVPVADVEVTAFPAGTVVDGSTVPDASTFSSPAGVPNAPEGSYALLLPPGTYDLYVQAQGATERTLAASDVVVAAGEITTQDLSIP
jgi:hypothetical protein